MRYEHPDYKGAKKNVVEEDVTVNEYLGNSELVLSVISATSRRQKYKLISKFRTKLIRNYGDTLMDVPETEPKLAELRDANRFLGDK